MLIYNHQKEFIGISQNYLSALGFSNLSELRSESADFADMFVKVPGFIHNFKHVHWIDFSVSSDSPDGMPVIIHAKSKNFQCSLDIERMYLTEDPHSPAYMISINNITETTDAKIKEASTSIIKKPLEVSSQPKLMPEPQLIPEIKEEPIELVMKEEVPIVKASKPLSTPAVDDAPIELDFTDTVEKEPLKKEVKTIQKEEIFDNGYVYQPQVASDELGLPLDLIEEFIEDFIAQAYEFKNGMYDALKSEDSDTLKILSHKLKGVAANLRIEDACDALTSINISADNHEIKSQLDLLYKIITKLSNKNTVVKVAKPTNINNGTKTNSIDDDIDLDIFIQKDEPTPTPTIPTKKKEAPKEVPPIVQEPEIKIDFPELKVDIPDKTEIANPKQVIEKQLQAQPIIYNKQKIANEIGMTDEEFSIIFNDYVEESQSIVQQIVDAVQSSDLRTISRKAMLLKGMNDNMRINECKDDLEMLLTVQDIEVAKPLIKKVKDIMQQLTQIKG